MTVAPAAFVAMGCEIVVAGADARELGAVRRLFAACEHVFSRFRPESELTAVNRSAGRATLVSPRFAEMVRCALGAAEATGGMVDPTVGGALDALGYSSDFAQLADDPAPAGHTGPAPGWRRVELRGRALRMPAGCVLDLNGVVKAATTDEAAGLLAGPGYVAAGGDLAVRMPTDVALPGGGAVRVARGGIATTGTGRRRWRRGGVWYHHLIDPATGLPARSPWQQVTASGASCLDADVAARAALLLGHRGPAWLDEHGIAGRFVAAGGDVHANRTWSAMTGMPLCT